MADLAPVRAMVARPTGGDPLMAPADALSRIVRLTLGVTGLATEAFLALLARAVPADHLAAGAGGPRRPAGIAHRLPAIAIGLGFEAQRRSIRTAAALRNRLHPLHGIAAHPAARGPVAAVWRHLDLEDWTARGLAAQRRNELAAAAFLHELVGGLAAAVLEQVDVDAVVARADLDRIVDRLDLDAIVARVDIDAIVRRVDLAGVTRQVIDELDVSQIIRESSSTMTSETIDALRVRGMRADQVAGRIVDRVLRRTGDRQTSLGQSPAGHPAGGADG